MHACIPLKAEGFVHASRWKQRGSFNWKSSCWISKENRVRYDIDKPKKLVYTISMFDTWKLSFSIRIIKNAGMPGDRGQNTFDISIYRNFRYDIQHYKNTFWVFWGFRGRKERPKHKLRSIFFTIYNIGPHDALPREWARGRQIQCSITNKDM